MSNEVGNAKFQAITSYKVDTEIKNIENERDKQIAILFDWDDDGIVDEDEFEGRKQYQIDQNEDGMTFKNKNKDVTVSLKYNEFSQIKNYRLDNESLFSSYEWRYRNSGKSSLDVVWGKNGQGEISLDVTDNKNKSLTINNFKGQYANTNTKNVTISNSVFSERVYIDDSQNLTLNNTNIKKVSADKLKNVNLHNSTIDHFETLSYNNQKFTVSLTKDKGTKCGIKTLSRSIAKKDKDGIIHTADVTLFEKGPMTSENYQINKSSPIQKIYEASDRAKNILNNKVKLANDSIEIRNKIYGNLK